VHAQGDAAVPAVQAVADAAAVAAPPPAQAACAEPSAADRKQLEKQLHSVRPSATIRPVCAERNGWLVDSDAGAWLVPLHGYPSMLEPWTIGPVYDFDGDGHPEATTIATEGELKIWFDGGTRASYVLGVDGPQWLARDGKILLQRGATALAIAPAGVYPEDDEPPEPPRTAPAYSCTFDNDDTQGAAIAHALLRGRAPAPCAQLPAADKAAQEHAIATIVVAKRDLDGVGSIRFAWGCTSHGDTPVLADYRAFRDATGVELWSVRDGKARKLASATSSAPDEYSSSDRILLGPTGDFDGDGAAESIIESSHHASAYGTSATYQVMIGGALRTLPSDLVVRGAVGDRDGIVRTVTSLGPHVVTPCHSTDPNAQLDCELQPGTGSIKVETCGPWDWEKRAPTILVLGAANAFVPVPAAAAAAILKTTAGDRAALSAP
jgi:hypothetical protein